MSNTPFIGGNLELTAADNLRLRFDGSSSLIVKNSDELYNAVLPVMGDMVAKEFQGPNGSFWTVGWTLFGLTREMVLPTVGTIEQRAAGINAKTGASWSAFETASIDAMAFVALLQKLHGTKVPNGADVRAKAIAAAQANAVAKSALSQAF